MKTYTIKETCSRCPRVLDEREATLEEVISEDSAAEQVEITAHINAADKTHKFGQLCDTCVRYVSATLSELFTPIDSPSVNRTKRSKAVHASTVIADAAKGSDSINIEFTDD